MRGGGDKGEGFDLKGSTIDVKFGEGKSDDAERNWPERNW